MPNPTESKSDSKDDNKNLNKSIFVPTYIAFTNKTEKEQAIRILREANFYHQWGYTNIGITYSANHDQTLQIRQTYNAGQWKTHTNGANQAAVMAEVEKLLEEKDYAHLRGVFCILPVTTCAQVGGIGAVKQKWLEEDLEDIRQFLTQPKRVVLGWQNETSGKNAYAVGGSISKQLEAFVPNTRKTQNQFIQETLKDFQQQFLSTQTLLSTPVPPRKPAPAPKKQETDLAVIQDTDEDSKAFLKTVSDAYINICKIKTRAELAANMKVETFKNFNEFKTKSTVFPQLSDAEKSKYNAGHFPTQVIILKFKTLEDAQKFINAMREKNISCKVLEGPKNELKKDKAEVKTENKDEKKEEHHPPRIRP